MTTYPFEEHHRVVLVDSLANVHTPTLAELAGGLDITCDLTKDGLDLRRNTEGIARERWHSVLLGQDPGRYGFDSPTLKARRYTQGSDEHLWDAAQLDVQKFLVIRRGILYATAWDVGQKVEVIRFRFGQRTTGPSTANTNVTFTVPLFVDLDDDEASTAAAGAGTAFPSTTTYPATTLYPTT